LAVFLGIAAFLEPAATTGDPRLIERLIANLLSNALTNNTPGGRVSINTRTQDSHAILTIANTGPVVPPGQIDRLFEPFERLDTDATNADGAGLGLSNVQAIANAHNATLTARPQPEGGLYIEVDFPS
jgi:signal transduction histidine kinase